jgi:D-alanyl-lipoteichoic acid acyltransferase DltB (MBOAT superfamily)
VTFSWWKICLIGVCIVIVRLAFRALSQSKSQFGILAIINVVVLATLFQWGTAFSGLWVLLILAFIQYLLVSRGIQSKSFYRLGMIFPIVPLIFFKYVLAEPLAIGSFEFLWEQQKTLMLSQGGQALWQFDCYLPGLSYAAFRASFAAIEVRTGAVKELSFSSFLSFTLFFPTLSVGPIHTLTQFLKVTNDETASLPALHSLARIAIGAVKFTLFASYFAQLSYGDFILDGNLHELADLFLASGFYYLYLYSNFSGFCDIAIGISGLMNIRIEENFNFPFLARNIQDLWQRWHITLGTYMRVVVFTPLTKSLLSSNYGQARPQMCTATSLIVVFVLVGVWHGYGFNFLYFGIFHGLGMVVHFFYGQGLRKFLSKKTLRAYMKSRIVRVTTTIMTFVFMSLSMMFFSVELFYSDEFGRILKLWVKG